MLRAALHAYHEIEPVVQGGGRSQLSRGADGDGAASRQRAWPGSFRPARAGLLAQSLPSWPPFPDSNAALERLADAGCRLGILSNVDDDLLAGSRRLLAPRFDPGLIVTAQQVRSYKPAPGHFEAARQRIGQGRWLHVAQSLYHDVAACRRLGVPVVWINRKGERPAAPPGVEAEFPTLLAFAEWLTRA